MNLPIGFAQARIVNDPVNGTNYEIVDANEIFGEYFKLDVSDYKDKILKESKIEVLQDINAWFTAYNNSGTKEGDLMDVEITMESLQKVFNTVMYKSEADYINMVVIDVTKQKETEEKLSKAIVDANAAYNYTGYSYIEPFLQKVAGLSANWVTTTLTIFGAAGLLGSFLFSHYYDKNKYLFVKLVMISVAAALLLLYPISKAHLAVVLLCACWGMAVMAFNVTFQSEIITYAPAAASSVAMAIYSGIYNLGIGSGTWIGVSICTHLSISYIGIAGGMIAVVAALLCIFVVIKYMKEFDRAA